MLVLCTAFYAFRGLHLIPEFVLGRAPLAGAAGLGLTSCMVTACAWCGVKTAFLV